MGCTPSSWRRPWWRGPPRQIPLRPCDSSREPRWVEGEATCSFKPGGHVLVRRIWAETPAGPGPRFRLAYRRTGAETVSLAFEIAPPGKPEAFATYLRADLRRKS